MNSPPRPPSSDETCSCEGKDISIALPRMPGCKSCSLRRFLKRHIKRPISAALAGSENSSVFLHMDLRTGFPYVLAESGLRRERTKRPEIGGRNGHAAWLALARDSMG